MENPAWGQFNMPATIEELPAGLSEVVKGLVGAIQLQAQSTTSHADSTSTSLNSNLTTLRLPTLQLPTFRQDTKVQDDIAEFLERFQEQTSHHSPVPSRTTVHWGMATFCVVILSRYRKL